MATSPYLINQVENTVLEYTENSINYRRLTLVCDEGYKFDASNMPVANGFRPTAGNPPTSDTFTYQDEKNAYINSFYSRMSEKYPITVTGSVIADGGSTGEFPANFVVQIEHVQDNGSAFADGVWNVALICESGWRFVEAPKVGYRNNYGQLGQFPMQLSKDGTEATMQIQDVSENTELTFTGSTTNEEPEPEPTFTITNNVPNTTAASEPANPTDNKCTITLTANDGYRIENATLQFMTRYGTPDTKDFTVSADGKTASCSIGDVEFADLTNGVTINGSTSEETPELNVTNNIAGTTEQHTFDGVTATFTVTGNGASKRFINPQLKYTSTDGTEKTVNMQTQELQSSSQATATVSDIDASEPVTLTGSFENVVFIHTDLTTCELETPLPEWVQQGETVNVTLKADAGTEFPTEGDNVPRIRIQSYTASFELLTVSEDKTEATGSVTVGDWQYITVMGETTPISVVGTQYGAINVYLVTLDELAEFSGKRFFKVTDTDPSTGAPQYENIDLGAYVNKIRRVYTNIGASSTDVIRCGNYNTGVSCHQPAQDKITLDFGTAVVPAHNEDNTDYESEIQIFLPFAGFVTLNTDYAGKTIALQYVINVVTGNGVALLSCNGVVFQVEETEPSSEIIYLSPSTQVKTVGGDDWNEMLYYGLEPYIYCKWYESASNGRNNDRQTGEIGDFRGFNVFDDVTPIHTAEMLAEEQEMIYAALSDGVYIE